MAKPTAREADLILGVFDRRRTAAAGAPGAADTRTGTGTGDAEVIDFLPFLLARLAPDSA